MPGRLAGIARHDRPFGPVETLDHISVTQTEGLHGDFRGGRASTKPSRKRQVSLIEAEGVTAAMAEAGAVIDWSDCRRNLLVQGVRLPRAPGTRVQIGDSLETAVLEGKLARVVSWYDNEWGFSNRMIDTAGVMAKLL